MLEHIWHWRFAKKLSPALQENRLLCFANGDPETDPLQTQETYAAAGLHPDGTPLEGGTAHVENTERSPERISEDTQVEVSNALQTPESVLSRAQSAKTRLRDTMNRFDMYKDQPEVKKIIDNVMIWQKGTEARLVLVNKVLETQQDWERGSLAPADYRDAIQGFIHDVSGEEKAITLADEYDMSLSEWMALPPDERRKIQEQINRNFEAQDVGNPTKHAEQIIEEIESYLKENEEGLEKFAMELGKGEEEGPGATTTIIASMKSAFGNIQFVSIMDVIHAGQKYVEGLKSAWEKRSQRISAGLATDIGSALRFLPLGNEVYTELSTARESKNQEEKNQQKELMKQNNTTFPEATVMLNQLRYNANKFNGAMEYMAERGWLYDLNIGARKLFGVTIPKPEGWSRESYRENLIRMQSEDSSGQETQKKRMENLIGTDADIEPIAESLEIELNNFNYWAAYTALEIAMKKGKIGESGTWMITILLSHLRKNPEARKYIPIDILDQIGNRGIEHPAWTPTFLKINRPQLTAWQKSQKSDGPDLFQYAGDLAKAITIIEADIAGKFGSTDKEIAEKFGPKVLTLNQLVARVLAAQVVTYGDQTVSIFDNRYSEYRRAILEKNTSIDAGKADDDFYGNISDAFLVGSSGLRSILTLTTQGGFTYLQKANYYIENIFLLDKQLQEHGTEEAKRNYRNEMSKKLNQYLIEDASRQGATKLGWKNRTSNGKTLLPEFLSHGLISQEAYDTIMKN
ncbi:MAG: hypothetical protein O3A80_04725 [bacterium]|nr:hypothetical protein [bacterium]